MTTIIGLLGPAGSGKSTCAKHLVEHYGARVYSFAGPLKEIVRLALGFTHEQVYGTQEQKEAVDPRYGHSPRWFLQKIGTEGVRAVLGPDFWWNYAVEKIMRDAPELAVIDDVRFVNEARGVMESDYEPGCTGPIDGVRPYVWRLEPRRDGASTADPTHASEAEWSAAPYDIRIAPREYGIKHLLEMVDRAAEFCGLSPTSARAICLDGGSGSDTVTPSV